MRTVVSNKLVQFFGKFNDCFNDYTSLLYYDIYYWMLVLAGAGATQLSNTERLRQQLWALWQAITMPQILLPAAFIFLWQVNAAHSHFKTLDTSVMSAGHLSFWRFPAELHREPLQQ